MLMLGAKVCFLLKNLQKVCINIVKIDNKHKVIKQPFSPRTSQIKANVDKRRKSVSRV